MTKITIRSRFFFFSLFLFVALSPLHAYIDPGTGSLIVSTLIGVLLTLLFSLKGLFYRIINSLTGSQKGVVFDYSGKLVLFSEGRNYYATFQPVISALIERKQHFVYLSADKDDPCLTETESPYVTTACLGNIRQAVVVLNKIKADTVVMTTPQLGILHLKRSRYVNSYIHVMHAPTDIHTYELFAFDCFDAVLCSCQANIDHIRELEELRKIPPSTLLETGCPYYDLAPENIDGPQDAVLLAPTWGEKSFLGKVDHGFIRKILDAGHTLIFRPHPQSWESDKALLNSIIEAYGSDPRFIVDQATDNSESLGRARILICDISGIIYDFAFLQKRPVIAVELEWDHAGFESSDLQSPHAVLSLLEDVGKTIQPDQVQDIDCVIEQLLEKTNGDIAIDNHIFNFRKAGIVAADQIQAIHKGSM